MWTVIFYVSKICYQVCTNLPPFSTFLIQTKTPLLLDSPHVHQGIAVFVLAPFTSPQWGCPLWVPESFDPVYAAGDSFQSLRESKSRVNELTRSHVVLNRGVYNMSSNWNRSESNWTPNKKYLLHWVFPGYPSQLVLLHHPAHTPSPGVFDGLQPPVSMLYYPILFSPPSLPLQLPSSNLTCTFQCNHL